MNEQHVGEKCQPENRTWDPLEDGRLKEKINELIWMYARPGVTLREAEMAACAAYDALEAIMGAHG